MRKIIGVLLLIAISYGHLLAHSGKPAYHVIIDTDGALDDMRSISMLLSENDIRVLAITCSQGTLLPDSVYVKIKSLLSVYHHEGIPVGIGDRLKKELPVWSPFAQNIVWGNPINTRNLDFSNKATNLLNNTIENYNKKITLIALGSLKTYADLINENPDLSDKIDRIIWYNSHKVEEGYNYEVSPESYEYIKQTGIQLDIVSNHSSKFIVNKNYIESIKAANSIYASQIAAVHMQPEIIERIDQEHLQLWDDIVPIYLTTPILFETEIKEKIKYVSIIKGLPQSLFNETVVHLLESATVTNNRVFVKFPIDSTLYKPDYAKILNSTIENYGLIEWKAISMTNEIHGHTGIYSIIGAKMGVRAMEFFNVGVNNVEVITFAGKKPPLSCFNDGIQISSGATIGQGLITVSDSISKIPSAIFEFNNQQVSISLKPEIAEKMGKEIKHGIQEHGLLTDAYWLYIEKLAINYWTNFNRHDIFIIETL